MSSLVLNSVTDRQLASLQNGTAHAIMLVGRAGGGKSALAQHLAESLLQIASGSFLAYQYGMILQPPDGKSLGIEQVRQLEHFLSLRVPAGGQLNRVVVIEEAQTMTHEAQNALLKTLEEPPLGTMIILTATSPQLLLPTIRSRTQIIHIQSPLENVLTEYFIAEGSSAEAVRQAYVISGGLPGLMQALLGDDAHPLRAATEQARAMLAAPLFVRLTLVDALAKQRTLAADTLCILEQMATISLQTAHGTAAAKWRRVLASSYEAREALAENAQPKLVLTNLVVKL